MNTMDENLDNVIEKLEKQRDDLSMIIEEYLLVLGVEYSMLKDVICDLKDQMYSHADHFINDMIADLINLENSILYAKQEQRKKLNEPPQPS